MNEEMSLQEQHGAPIRSLEQIPSPAVSIIIPAYDLEPYIGECLESIAAQTLPSYEVIVVDDGSSDGTVAAVEAFCARDGRFRLLQQPHENAGVARNNGLAIARGEYLLFFDGDDVMAPTMLEQMVTCAERTQADITVCRAHSYIDEPFQMLDEDFGPYGIDFNRVYSADDLAENLFETCVGWPWDKLFRRSFVERTGLRFQSLPSTNDAFFVFVSMALAQRIAFLDEFLVMHRRRAGSIEKGRNAGPHNAFRAYEAIEARLRALPQWDAYLKSACMNWALTHLRWNYRTLKGEARLQAFEDYRQVLEALADEPNEFFRHREDVWVRDALSTDRAARDCLLADSTIDMDYGREDLDKLHARLGDMQRQLEDERLRANEEIEALRSKVKWLEESTSYKVGLAVTAIPRRMKDTMRFGNDGEV